MWFGIAVIIAEQVFHNTDDNVVLFIAEKKGILIKVR